MTQKYTKTTMLALLLIVTFFIESNLVAQAEISGSHQIFLPAVFTSNGTSSNDEMVSAAGLYKTIKVLSYNVAGLRKTDSNKIRNIGNAILRQNPDVIVFQELMLDKDKNQIVRHLQSRYPHHTKTVGRSRILPVFGKKVPRDGGVFIMSKFPIEREFERLYGDSCYGNAALIISLVPLELKASYGDADCLADKGVIYGRINVHGTRVHLFGTHVDAGGSNLDQIARRQQFNIIRNLIRSMSIPSNQPVFIAGDLNVDYHNSRNEFNNMVNTLSAQLPFATGGGTPGMSGGNNNNESLLDYVLYSRSHLRPTQATNDVRVFRDASGRFLSDHHPVEGKFTFKPALFSRGTFPFATFFEGNNATQDFVCNVSLENSKTLRFPDEWECINDEVRSMILFDTPANTVLRLFDNTGSDRYRKGWVEIRTKRFVHELRINSFQRSFENSDVKVTYHSDGNNLDGKVSRLEVSRGTSPLALFFEGNNATQDIVCHTSLATNRTLRFPDMSECINDEARSMILYDTPANTTLRLFDNTGGNRYRKGWVEIRTKSFVSELQINSFERSFENSSVKVTYHPDGNALDGKVSRLEVEH